MFKIFFKYGFKIFIEILFVVYVFFFFYWQSYNRYIYLHENVRSLKIGVPENIVLLSYKNINGEYQGKAIDVCRIIFKEKLGFNTQYELIDLDNRYIFYYDIIINQKKKEILSNVFLFSEKVIDCFDFIIIEDPSKNKKQVENTIPGILINGILFHFKKSNENYFIVNSIFDIVDNFNNNNINQFILESELYESFLNILRSKGINPAFFTYKKIKKEIEPIYFVFHYKLYWLLKLFNKFIYLMRDIYEEE